MGGSPLALPTSLRVRERACKEAQARGQAACQSKQGLVPCYAEP